MPTAQSKPSGFAPMALLFITIGALTTVWSGIWFLYLRNHSGGDGVAGYVCSGCLVTGLVLLAIGVAVGPMARWFRQADIHPEQDPSAPAGTGRISPGRF